MSAEAAKRHAALRALDFVAPGMTIGLGTGSTAAQFVMLLGERVRAGLAVRGVPTSEATKALAEAHGVPLIEANAAQAIALAVDGADEADPAGGLIKGGGGALLREKIIAAAADRFVVIIDRAKQVERLGAFGVPVEITPFAHALTARRVADAFAAIGAAPADIALRTAGPNAAPFITDGGNYVLDCRAGLIGDAAALAHALNAIPGVVEHGLFLDMADILIIGDAHGAVCVAL